MQLEKKSNNNINNKNVVNVIINTTKTKSRNSTRKSNSESSSYESPVQPFNNSLNLQSELLRQSLNDSPQINRPANPDLKIRPNEASFIDEGSAFPRVDLDEYESSSFRTPMIKKLGAKPKPKPKKSTKAVRMELLNEYQRLGGADPLILNSTRKPTIQKAISDLMR